MASSPMFGDVLSDRRRSLGLSIDRVVADTKLQRRMVEAFEDSDFEAMPPRGYAQASLASYARYLGLDSQELLRDYEDQLYEHQRETEMASRPPARGGRSREARPSEQGRQAARTGTWAASARDARPRGQERQDWQRARDTRPGAARRPWPEDGPGRERARDAGAAGDDRLRDYPYRGRASSVRQRDLGLYDRPSSLYGERAAGGGRAAQGAPSRDGARRSGRDESAGAWRDADRAMPLGRGRDEEPRPYAARDAGGARRSARDGGGYARPYEQRRQADRRRTELVGPDDGYEGGSGGEPDRSEARYRPRRAERRGSTARESLEEVARGLLDSVLSDRRTFTVIVAALAAALVVVLSVAISSCVRGSSGSDDGSGGTIPVTPVSQDGSSSSDSAEGQTQLAASVNLDAMPAGSSLKLFVSSDVASGPWVEVYVDGVAVRAETLEPGFAWEWPFTSSITVRLSGVDGVTLYLNDVLVAPTLDNGAFVLTASVAADQQPQQESSGA